MFSNHMPDGINFQSLEGNLYIFCQKKKKSSHRHVYLRGGGGRYVETKQSVNSLLYSFSLNYFQTYKAPGFHLFPSPPSKCICNMDLISPLCSLGPVLLFSKVPAFFTIMK